MKKTFTAAAIAAAFALPASAQQSVEVLHWWTAGGEAAALNVLKGNLEKQGVKWNDMPVAGGGGEAAMTAVRARVTSATATTVTCALWRNSVALVQFGADGLTPGAEVGQMLRVLAGKGAGQTRLITANTRDTHTVDTPWDIVPDSTSVVIVESPEWVNMSESSTPDVQRGRQHKLV